MPRPISPRETIKQAFAIELIKNGENWINMVEDRNLTSHTYDETKADELVNKINKIHFPLLKEFHSNFNAAKKQTLTKF